MIAPRPMARVDQANSDQPEFPSGVDEALAIAGGGSRMAPPTLAECGGGVPGGAVGTIVRVGVGVGVWVFVGAGV